MLTCINWVKKACQHTIPSMSDRRGISWCKNWHLPVELHIPCRAPLDHLMSILNYVKKQFNCDNTWKEQIDWILTNGPGNDRFSMNLLKIPNVNVKCIPYENIIKGQYFDSTLPPARWVRLTTPPLPSWAFGRSGRPPAIGRVSARGGRLSRRG